MSATPLPGAWNEIPFLSLSFRSSDSEASGESQMKYKEPAQGGRAAHYLPSRPWLLTVLSFVTAPASALEKHPVLVSCINIPEQPWEGSLAQPPRRCICVQSLSNLFGGLAEQDRAASPRCIEPDV